jgi:hypothetical protein
MKHIIFYSGGVGSWATAKRVIEKHGAEDVILLFTDTLIEDKDLYRFMIETAGELFNVHVSDLVDLTKNIPDVSHELMEERKQYLRELSELANKRIPQMNWSMDGRTPWEVFKKERWIGNSRIAQCSHKLKQDAAAKIINQYDPDEVVLYLGIDWTEDHRKEAPKKNWLPYKVEFPMCEEPFVVKEEMLADLNALGIASPRLYGKGFAHNNCGGFCVRGGQGHFINLLKEFPELYRYHEEKEEEMRQFLGKDTSILRKQKKKVKYQLTLKQLREEYEAKNMNNIDMDDIGGCGCMSYYPEEE